MTPQGPSGRWQGLGHSPLGDRGCAKDVEVQDRVGLEAEEDVSDRGAGVGHLDPGFGIGGGGVHSATTQEEVDGVGHVEQHTHPRVVPGAGAGLPPNQLLRMPLPSIIATVMLLFWVLLVLLMEGLG